jgi:hypothetical protein
VNLEEHHLGEAILGTVNLHLQAQGVRITTGTIVDATLAVFLEEMEQVVAWAKLCALIEPHYPKPGNGRRPKELEPMLRIYFLQQWFNLADPAVEEALYDSATLRQLPGLTWDQSRCRTRPRCASSGICCPPRLLRVPLESRHHRQCPLFAESVHAGTTLSILPVEREHLIRVSLGHPHHRGGCPCGGLHRHALGESAIPFNGSGTSKFQFHLHSDHARAAIAT